ncbi:tetratricopeptide repeat protein [Candidatus Peregrinibacteria bacterium]|nr:tetratricopeptide repeat protein [Candidatus Peregrinibacteria bacterium]
MNTQTLHSLTHSIRSGKTMLLATLAVIFFLEEIFLKKYSLAVFLLSGGILLFIVIRRFFFIQHELLLQKNFVKEENLKAELATENLQAPAPFRQKFSSMFLGRIKWDTCKRAASSFFTKADIASREHDTESAKKLLIQAIAMDPDHLDANFRLGILYLNDHEPAKASAMFRKLLEIKEDAEYLFKLSESLAEQEQKEEALTHGLRALELSPKKSCFFAHVGCLYWDMNEKAKAEEYFRKAVELDPKNEECLLRLVEYHQTLGDLAEQQELLRKMLFCRPHDEDLKAFIRGTQEK